MISTLTGISPGERQKSACSCLSNPVVERDAMCSLGDVAMTHIMLYQQFRDFETYVVCALGINS